MNAYLDLANCVVAWNRADRAGGGLGAAGTFYRVENSVAADNAAPAGAALWGESGHVSLEAEFHETVVARNAGASTFEAVSAATMTFTYSVFFANTGALAAGTIDEPQQSGGNLFADPLFVEPTWEQLDYLPGPGSPLIDAGIDGSASFDRDSTRSDIGISGGPASGWVAPRVPPELRTYSVDSYDVYIRWDGPRELIAAYYRSYDGTLPIESSYRFYPSEELTRGVIDTTLSPADTAAYYRVVPMDERGHAGSPSGLLRVVPVNQPPELLLVLDPLAESPTDSLYVWVYTGEWTTAATLTLNGSRFEMETRYSDNSFWTARVPRPNEEFLAIAEAADRYGAIGVDSLSGDFILLGPGREGNAFGTINLSADLEEDAVLLAERTVTPSLPNSFTPASEAFRFDVAWSEFGVRGDVDFRIVGPDVLLPDERIAMVFSGNVAEYEGARRDLPDRVRSARVPFDLLLNARAVLLVARDAPLPDQGRFTLSDPIPNPARGVSAVRFDITRWGGEPVWLGIYDVSGRLIREVHDGPVPTGRYSFAWDGRNDRGELVPSGHYIISGRAGGIGSSRHLTLIR